MLAGFGNEPDDLDQYDYLWGRADAIIKKCVIPLGVGGWAKAGKTLPIVLHFRI